MVRKAICRVGTAFRSGDRYFGNEMGAVQESTLQQ